MVSDDDAGKLPSDFRPSQASRKAVVIVDAFSTGKLIAPKLKGQGLDVIHVASSCAILRCRRSDLRPEFFALSLHHEVDPQGVLDELRSRRWDIVGVIAGSETGVFLADDLSAALELQNGNDPKSKLKRRNKVDMYRAAKDHDIPTMRTLHGSSPEELLEKCERERMPYPVVVKPSMSAGTDGVYWCESRPSIARAVSQLLKKTNLLGEKNREAVVQRFYEGREYVVDTVSWDGDHRIVDVFRTKKGKYNDAAFVPEHTTTLPSSHRLRAKLSDFAERVLDALDIRFGAGHVEIIDAKDGLVLVECAARTHGAEFPRFCEVAWGHSQVTQLVDAYVGQRLPPATTPRPNQLCIVELIANCEGVVVDWHGLSTVRALSTYLCETVVDPGTPVQRTRDAHSSPGAVVLSSTSAEAMKRDYKTVRRLEEQGKLFSVRAMGGADAMGADSNQ